MSFTTRIKVTLQARHTDRSLGFALATWRNTHPSLQTTR